MRNNLIELSKTVNEKYFKAKNDLKALSDNLNKNGVIVNVFIKINKDYDLFYARLNNVFQIYLRDFNDETYIIEQMNIDKVYMVIENIHILIDTIQSRLTFLNGKYDELSMDFGSNQ